MNSATITIFDERNNRLVTLYRKNYGGIDMLGQELSNFLSEFAITPQWQTRLPLKSAQGMGDLAAQLIKRLKVGVGADFAIVQPIIEEYNYEIRYVAPPTWGGSGRVSLVGSVPSMGFNHKFKLYSDDPAPVILRRVQFVYDKRDGEQATWRTVDVTAENARYIEGYQDGQFKRFLKNKILGDKILPA